MQYKTCLFCKRSMDQFCYSIYDPSNQPYLNIMQLFGDVEENLRHGRCICHECLYLIRWIYFMKKILADALLDEDTGEYDKVIPAFNIFKVKMSQPIFILSGENEDEESGGEREEDYAVNGKVRTPNNNWWPAQSRENTKKQQYSCSLHICEHKCDTFDELKTHHKLHHQIEENDLTIESYEKQLGELSTTNRSVQNSRRKKFRCFLTQCRRAFKSIESLSEHKVKEHDLMAKFWCAECYNLKFTSREDLNHHTQTFHARNNITERTNEYPCKYCDKYFLERSVLSAHQLKYHHQFLEQNERYTRTILKKQVWGVSSVVNLEKIEVETKRGMCSFKTRRQKDIATRQRRQQDILFKCMRSKYPNFNPTRVCTVEQRIKDAGDQEKEKILISLPPRKRRLYQVANEIAVEMPKVVHVDISTNNSVVSLPMIAEPAEITSTATDIMSKEVELATVVETIKADEKIADIVDKVDAQETLNTVDISKENLTKIDEVKDIEVKTSVPIEEILLVEETKPETVLQEKTIITVKNLHEGEIIPLETLQENKADFKQAQPLLKTTNVRKRKKPTKGKTNAQKKVMMEKVVEKSEAITQVPLNLSISEENVPEPFATTKNASLSSDLPVMSQINQDADNDNCPGRITMKISLKAIRESKRKKKLKGKKKSKTQVSSSSPLKKENKLVNGLEPTKNVQQPLAYYSQTSISESENETRNEIVLNKEEINMIIFGDTTLNGNNVTVVNEQIIDCNQQVASINPISQASAPVQGAGPPSVVKKKVTKAKVSKKRKVKRPNVKAPNNIQTLNVENKPEYLDVSKTEDTVEGQIANIQLKDHLYAISAFNAFKHSK